MILGAATAGATEVRLLAGGRTRTLSPVLERRVLSRHLPPGPGSTDEQYGCNAFREYAAHTGTGLLPA